VNKDLSTYLPIYLFMYLFIYVIEDGLRICMYVLSDCAYFIAFLPYYFICTCTSNACVRNCHLQDKVLTFFLSFLGWGETVHLVCRPVTGLLYQPRMIDDKCRAVGKIRIGRGNWSTRRKPAPVPFCLPQIAHDLTWAAAEGSRRLTAWGMKRPRVLT
jgi:hypothetical protein